MDKKDKEKYKDKLLKKKEEIVEALSEAYTESKEVETGIAQNDIFVTLEITRAGRTEDQFAAGHALADVIVGITLQVHMQAAGIPDAETLPCRTPEPDDQRRLLHAGVAVTTRDFARYPCTDRTVRIMYPVFILPRHAFVDRGQHVIDHLLGELSLVKRHIPLQRAPVRLVCRHTAVG